MGNRNAFKRFVAHVLLMATSVLFIAPFVWMVSTSLKHESRIFPESGKPRNGFQRRNGWTIKGDE